MRKTCGYCGRVFEAKRAAARWCGPTCRKRASRNPGGVRPVDPAVVVDLGRGDGAEDAPGPLVEATTAELERAGRLGTATGVAALVLARRIDRGGEPGAAMASLVREYRATLADALKDVEKADDELDRIRGAAALKLLHGGRGRPA